ncbi:M10 family metallopeptidase C-terminal domain-containing protein [Microvirga flavescens]|uniref:M10 family metallopeptidase C-terminal domain-containing protein n=1 Tax=Microvirga flavescens TaxID=2249811 RepID=UPI000DD75599|nr:M10 family metallopeptidase C-terminal domain-containing protein [Microvirga flavescens]
MSWFSDAFRSAGNWIGDQVEAIGNWFGDAANSAWNWISDNISGLPLNFFSVMGTLFPSWNIGGVQYFTPSHSDSDVKSLISGSKWADSTITYSLPDSRSDYEAINPSASGYKPLSAEVESAVHEVMASVAGYVTTGISYAGRNDANIKVAAFEPGSIIVNSHGYYPGVPVYGGDTWLTLGTSTSAQKGSRPYLLAMHELGHSLGLKHTHDSGWGLPKTSAVHDSIEYTVMSYNKTIDSPQTFMQYDIAALQLMYGADFGTNSGNTVYRWSSLTGEMFVNGAGQGVPSDNHIFLTVWDGGGVDTYDLSNFWNNAVVDLTPGGVSRFSDAQLGRKDGTSFVNGNVYNAFQYNGDPRSLIENATTGSGNDKIIGNSANNVLSGNSGNDSLHGGNGSDSLYGGLGNDVLDDAVPSSSAGNYVYGNDYMSGGDGDDRIFGRFGNDKLYGDDGNDYIDAGEDNDVAYGGNGHDIVIGFTGNDELYGDAGNDTLYGGDGSDALYGGAGDDLLDDAIPGFGNFVYGNDMMNGGAGNDRIFGRFGNDLLVGDDGNDYIDAGEDNDVVYGGYGQDTIIGYTGNDHLVGDAGDDVIYGGQGNDVLYGGAGRDIVVFDTALDRYYNVDQMWDFNTYEDQIRLDRGIFKGFGWSVALSIGASAKGWGAQIVYNNVTGELFYDSDGFGYAAQIKFATLSAGLALTSANFVL